MPRRKTTKKAEKLEVGGLEKKFDASKFFYGLNIYLATAFLVLWILIGLFLVSLIALSFRQGAFKTILNPQEQQRTPQPQQPQVQSEAVLPGIGRVNIACVQNSLTEEELQKIIQTGDVSQLTDEEKSKLDPCVVERETASPSPSASPTNSPNR